MNLTLELTTDQVIGLIQQMPPKEKRSVLLALAEQAEVNRAARMEYAEAQFRKLCASRGLDWDTMTEAERENFVDDLIHRETTIDHTSNSVVVALKNYQNHHYKDDRSELPRESGRRGDIRCETPESEIPRRTGLASLEDRKGLVFSHQTPV